ncbi:histidine phosphatase family protein [Amycolatopsis sp. 195334CR]|uniref:histidine phosphatase family protein n=1 Tax=Amycolatopsis sp. 195334CR TaxID=2814588 RepID=UPI001A8E8E1C|nr:histidine phosphatase family protein [Amycolatopsis sp. 195334CR]MBN6033499.1 histidine phosphatase family protein [Amycolatopsis sp. 195334CR]
MGAIYLIRHGQASFGAEDYDRLSDRGIRQSEVVGAELARRGVEFAQARCGSLSRQRATAAGALKVLGGPAEVGEDARWNEYDHIDIAQHHGGGISQDSADPRAFQAALDQALVDWVLAGDESPCAESWPAFLHRVSGALADLAGALGKGQDAAVFTSGGVIAVICGALTGTPEAGLVKFNRVTVNGGITKLVSGRGGVSLLSFNEHAHFSGEAEALLTYR